MSKRLHRSRQEPCRIGLKWEELWEGSDNGLIWCWERGREKSREDPELAARALRGELVILAWKGGVDEKLKSGKKFGSLQYFATWQGLRGEDLDIELEDEFVVICTRTGQPVLFRAKLPCDAEDEEKTSGIATSSGV